MFKEVVKLIEDIKITDESIFPKFFDSIQLDGAKEIDEVHETKNSGKTNEEDSIFPDFFKDIILK